MANRISEKEFEAYYLHDSSVCVVDVHPNHLARVAEILSERHPGIIFIWSTGRRAKSVTICAVRRDRHQISGMAEEKLVAAGELIAHHVANKHPVRWWKPRVRGRSGWHFTPVQEQRSTPGFLGRIARLLFKIVVMGIAVIATIVFYYRTRLHF